MIPMTTRRPRIAFWACLLTGALTGCDDSNIDGGSSSCTDSFGPPAAIEETLDTFRVGSGQEDRRNSLKTEQTVFYSFFQALQPLENTESEEEAEQLAQATRSLTAQFIDPDGGLPAYTSTRNAADLSESLIQSGVVSLFGEARGAIQNCIQEQEQGNFDLLDIVMKEKKDSDEGSKIKDEIALGAFYANNPSPNESTGSFGPNVRRLVASETAFLFSLYDPQTFAEAGSSGYIEPGRISFFTNVALVDIDTIEDTEGENLFAEDTTDTVEQSLIFASYRDQHFDQWEWTAGEETPEEIQMDGETIEARCIRVIIEYEADTQVNVWASNKACRSSSEDDGSLKEREITYQSAETQQVQR